VSKHLPTGNPPAYSIRAQVRGRRSSRRARAPRRRCTERRPRSTQSAVAGTPLGETTKRTADDVGIVAGMSSGAGLAGAAGRTTDGHVAPPGEDQTRSRLFGQGYAPSRLLARRNISRHHALGPRSRRRSAGKAGRPHHSLPVWASRHDEAPAGSKQQARTVQASDAARAGLEGRPAGPALRALKLLRAKLGAARPGGRSAAPRSAAETRSLPMLCVPIGHLSLGYLGVGPGRRAVSGWRKRPVHNVQGPARGLAGWSRGAQGGQFFQASGDQRSPSRSKQQAAPVRVGAGGFIRFQPRTRPPCGRKPHTDRTPVGRGHAGGRLPFALGAASARWRLHRSGARVPSHRLRLGGRRRRLSALVRGRASGETAPRPGWRARSGQIGLGPGRTCTCPPPERGPVKQQAATCGFRGGQLRRALRARAPKAEQAQARGRHRPARADYFWKPETVAWP